MSVYKASLLASAAVAILAGTGIFTVVVAADPASSLQEFKTSEDSGTLQRANGDMKKVLLELQALKGKPIETLTPEDARKQPTPADAVMALLKKEGKDPEELKTASGVTTKDLTYKGAKEELPVRVYYPPNADREGKKALPVIVYFHGGGFVIADINVYDATPRALAKKTGAIVVSPEYRRAPESKFPAAHDDAIAAYKWTLANASEWGADPKKIAVAGESAGGNLAANVAIAARQEKLIKPLHMLLVYPVAGNDMTTESYVKNEKAKPLNKAMMEWFVKHALPKASDKDDPRINLVAADLANLPSATIITAEIDPLLSEGKLLGDKLKAAGNKVDYHTYAGVTHEFFGMDAVVSRAAEAQDQAAENLKAAFKKK